MSEGMNCPGCGGHVYDPDAHIWHLFDAVSKLRSDLELLKKRLAEPMIFNIPSLGEGDEAS